MSKKQKAQFVPPTEEDKSKAIAMGPELEALKEEAKAMLADIPEDQLLDEADKAFIEHMEQLTPSEVTMLDGVELGGVKVELQESVVPLPPPLPQMEPKWPTEEFTINWPWGDEPDPLVGQVVGWNWERNEVAVIKEQPPIMSSEPWTVKIAIEPMPEQLVASRSRVLNLENGYMIIGLQWYTAWNRAGMTGWGPTGARCTVLQ